MAWDPAHYLRFADHRTRPGVELLQRIPEIDARSVVDLGCGTGHLTALLARRWPQAEVVGIDSSPEMIEQAHSGHPDVEFRLLDIAGWEPDRPVDVVFSNAALHWLGDHARLFPRLRRSVAHGGVLAVQMPDNWQAPTHRIPAEILDDGSWPEVARTALMRDRLAAPADYARWVSPAAVDLWRTTYYQRLTGADPVWDWVTGSLLRPVLAALDEPDGQRFGEVSRARYREAYPPDADGVVTLPFSRLFLVATAP